MKDDEIYVCIVEDNEEIRKTLAKIIDGTEGFICKHTFDNGEEAVKKLPDIYTNVVLTDIELPGIAGIEVVKQLKPVLPSVDFIMLTIKRDDESIFKSLCSGATGYLTKETPPTRILQSIQEVYAGGAPMNSGIARKVIASFKSQSKKSPLSNRETEILKLLCDGLNYKSIATELFISAHTVRTHMKNIYKKLHVNSRAEVVSRAIKDNLV